MSIKRIFWSALLAACLFPPVTNAQGGSAAEVEKIFATHSRHLDRLSSTKSVESPIKTAHAEVGLKRVPIEHEAQGLEAKTEGRSGGESNPSEGGVFVNSLGMRFTPVPGTDVLFSMWETRKGDYTAYAKANPGVNNSWQNVIFKGVGVSTGEDHPVVSVSWNDATAFCKWLTRKEQGEGKIGRDALYRLPTDQEWSMAVGLTNEIGSTPEEKDEKIKDVYPWGAQWPPPPKAGNYADITMKFTERTIIEGYRDGFATTAPVGSFTANRFGLFDMSGNVREWCEDFNNGRSGNRVLRGGAWNFSTPARLLSSSRPGLAAGNRIINIGFRVVLVEVSAR